MLYQMNSQILSKADKFFDEQKEEIINSLSRLVRIESISIKGESKENPFGQGCTKVVNEGVAIAKEFGLQARSEQNTYGLARVGRGEKKIGIFSHLDIVPPGEGWTEDPYTPVIKGDIIVGRGVGDNKSAAVLGLYLLRCIQSLNIQLHSSVELYMGTNEECGMEDIKQYVKNETLPYLSLVADVGFPVCHAEKGLIQCVYKGEAGTARIESIVGGIASNVIPDRSVCILKCTEQEYEILACCADKFGTKIKLDYNAQTGKATIKAIGKTGHCASPEGGLNANGLLTDFLVQCGLCKEHEQQVLTMLCKFLNDFYGEGLGIAFEDSVSGKLTAAGCMLNWKDGKYDLDINIRYPVTDDMDRILNQLECNAQEAGCVFEIISKSKPTYTDANSRLVTMLCELYNDYTGEKTVPYIMGGGTYARCLPNAIGFGPGISRYELGQPAGKGGGHQPDESYSIPALIEACKIYFRAILQLDQAIYEGII